MLSTILLAAFSELYENKLLAIELIYLPLPDIY